MRSLTCALFILALATFAGCAADPAADKPDAAVAEPIPASPAADDGTMLSLNETSAIGWVGSKVTGSHEGGFKVFEGQVNLVDDDPTKSSVSITIDVSSMWSDNDDLTGHLLSPDFFDAATHPTATFESTSIAAAETGYVATGNLNLHGVEKSISFPVEITVTDGAVKILASFSIKRFDFGIEYTGPTDNLIRDEVAITLDLQAG